MAFREVIEAVLKVKDANRFKAGMDKAARSVRKLGRDEEEAAAQTEILKSMEAKLERQSLELTAALHLVANAVEEVGQEMIQTAAKTQLANQAMKKSGSNAVFLGKSWAFWKDRLSLTRSEIITTSLTIGAYFSPAILAMGSSFAYAAMGGGGVAFGGLSTFILGMVSLSTVMKPVTEGIDKVMKAQDQYNLAVEQFGANSLQASRASAHMYGVIRTHGGRPVLRAVTNLRKFTKEWARLTGPARGALLSTMSKGLASMRRGVLPTLGTGTNQIAMEIQKAMGGVFKQLRGDEMLQTFRTMFQTFDKAIGPGIRGAMNMLIVIGRIIRASAPYVVEWAQAWERTTESWRDSTSDQSKVERFFRGAVTHFKVWWGLAKQLARTLKIIFGASKDEGLKVVTVLTDLVTRFNNWLQIASDTGKIDEFWRKYNRSVTDAVWALQHPVQAINRWLPVVMDAIATTMATHAPKTAEIFIRAFLNAGGWAQFLTVAFFMKKFGFFRLLGARVAAIFITPFLGAFGSAFAARMGIQFAAGSAISTAMAGAGTRMGGAFGAAFQVAALAGLAAVLVMYEDEITKWLDKHTPFDVNKPGTKEADKYGETKGILEPLIRKNPQLDWLYDKLAGGATGGVIPPGGTALVGEAGPELATMGPHGTKVTPLSRNSRHTLPAALDVPNLEGAIRLTSFISVQVDRREIARAVNDQNSYTTARRGGRPA